MKKAMGLFSMFAVVSFLSLTLGSAKADSVTFSELEAVNSDGSSAYTDDGSTRTITGVVINNPADMLDSSYKTGWVGYQWQAFIQSLSMSSDFGGAALYACSDGSKMGGNVLSTDQWNSLLTSLSGLKYGDVVQVTFYATNAYEGKTNITSNHNLKSQFSVSVIGSAMPTVSNITLADLKSSDDSFIFDSTRATGCEHYQGTLVHLTGLSVVGGTTNWALGKTVQVEQNGLTFDLQVGLNSSLLSESVLEEVNSGSLDITAILDQEDGSYVGDSGYSLWLTSVPEPGTWALLIAGLIGLAGYAWRKRQKA